MELIDIKKPFYSNNKIKVSLDTKYGKLTNFSPKIVACTVVAISEKYKGIDVKILLITVLIKMAQVVTTKRVKYKEFENIGSPNLFVLTLMPSGIGKDKIIDDLDKHFFSSFRTWFYNEVEIYKERMYTEIENKSYELCNTGQITEKQRLAYIKEEKRKIRTLVLEISDGTREGFYATAKAFSLAGFGSLFFKMSEFGVFLNNATQEQKLFLDTLLEAYNGKFQAKNIKSEDCEKAIESMPANALLYSDPTLFQAELYKKFINLLSTGYGRRFIILFMPKEEKYELEVNAKKDRLSNEIYFKNLKSLGQKFWEIFNSIESETEYVITDETLDNVLHPYRLKINGEYGIEQNEIIKKEIKSRELKVIKLSTLYAIISHANEHFVYPEDMKMAINTIELVCKDLKNFLNYRPKYDDKYDRLFNFFIEHKNEKFTKSQLVNEHYQLSGYSRDKFRENFDNCMSIVNEIATSKGYIINETKINNNSGTAYSLIPMQAEILNDNVVTLSELI